MWPDEQAQLRGPSLVNGVHILQKRGVDREIGQKVSAATML